MVRCGGMGRWGITTTTTVVTDGVGGSDGGMCVEGTVGWMWRVGQTRIRVHGMIFFKELLVIWDGIIHGYTCRRMYSHVSQDA